MRSLVVTVLALLLVNGSAFSQRVHLVSASSEPEAGYAARKLTAALQSRGYSVVDAARADDYRIRIAVNGDGLGEEAFTIVPEGRTISVYGGDGRGMLYGALALADDVRNGVPLAEVKRRTEKPRLPFRAIKFNLPWDSYRASASLDQHTEVVRDLAYWESFLDMMVENRFNTITLWNLHPFTYMFRPRNFPEASRFTEAEQEEWRRLYRGIFRMAKERGLDTYVVTFSIFVSPEFAKAHNVGLKNHYPHYNVPGDTSEVIKRYIRESVVQMLEEYPELDGIGITHGEGMGGMTPRQRQKWLDDTYLAAIRQVKRPVKLIHRVPLSGNETAGAQSNSDTETFTRQEMEAIDYVEGPIWVEMKFNWSHGHSTPKLVKVHGGPLGPTYFTPEPRNYKVTWMMRNEDFFALRWGVPSFLRAHIRENGSASYSGGYFVGSESYIPALDYFTAVDRRGEWKYAFERQWLFYKLWGRLLYDVETPDSVFVAEFVRRYGPAGRNLLRAYELASATQLRLASLYDSRWDFTLYSEGMLSIRGSDMTYIGIDRLIQSPVLDPSYVSIADYVAAQREGRAFEAGRVTPPILADRLEADSREALRLVEGIDTSGKVALTYEVADVRAWAHLGLHLAEKIRGGVALQTYRQAGGEENKARAVAHLERALAEWDEVVRVTRPLYRDMPLTHYVGLSSMPRPDREFHWALIRPQVAEDVVTARNAVVGGTAAR